MVALLISNFCQADLVEIETLRKTDTVYTTTTRSQSEEPP